MTSDEAVVVDVGPAEALGDPELRAWGRDQRVFISSVMSGMEKERASVASAVDDVGATPVWFERFGGRDDDPEAAYLSEVAGSDIYVGILGERYGRPAASGYSATHAEYREAIRCGLRLSVWACNGTLSGPQRDFLDEVQVFRTSGTYSDAQDLSQGVGARLRALAAESVSPWVKLGSTVFRARRVVFDGTQVRVEARVRDDRVVAAIEGLRGRDAFRGGMTVAITWSGQTEWVTVKTIEAETTAGRGRLLTIVAERTGQGNRKSSLSDVAFNNRTPDDLTELALRVALLGEANPLEDMRFMAAIDNPLDAIDRLRLPEDAVEPVAHLLLTESLVGSGRATRITSLQVGPRRGGARRIAVSWLPPRRYTDEVPRERQLDGELQTGT